MFKSKWQKIYLKYFKDLINMRFRLISYILWVKNFGNLKCRQNVAWIFAKLLVINVLWWVLDVNNKLALYSNFESFYIRLEIKRELTRLLMCKCLIQNNYIVSENTFNTFLYW